MSSTRRLRPRAGLALIFLQDPLPRMHTPTITEQTGKSCAFGMLYQIWRVDRRGINPDRIGTTAWKICRLLYEDGEWICSISRYPNLALVFGDVAEGAHESLPLAMLRTFLNARLLSLSLPEPTGSVPETGEVWGPVLCCDNLASTQRENGRLLIDQSDDSASRGDYASRGLGHRVRS
jgi:hypothetical protein